MVPGAVVDSGPPQVAVGPAVATVNPAGSVSVNPTPVSATWFGLLRVKVNADVAPNAMLVGANAFAITGGATTVSVAVLLIAPVPPLAEVTAPVVLFQLPAATPVTVTVEIEPK